MRKLLLMAMLALPVGEAFAEYANIEDVIMTTELQFQKLYKGKCVRGFGQVYEIEPNFYGIDVTLTVDGPDYNWIFLAIEHEKNKTLEESLQKYQAGQTFVFHATLNEFYFRDPAENTHTTVWATNGCETSQHDKTETPQKETLHSDHYTLGNVVKRFFA